MRCDIDSWTWIASALKSQLSFILVFDQNMQLLSTASFKLSRDTSAQRLKKIDQRTGIMENSSKINLSKEKLISLLETAERKCKDLENQVSHIYSPSSPVRFLHHLKTLTAFSRRTPV